MSLPRRTKTRRSFALACFLFALLLAPLAAHAQQLTPLRLTWDKWQLHDGNEPSCALPVAPACSTHPLEFADTNDANSWQRITVTLPPELAARPQLGLLVQIEYPVYQVFANGTFIGAQGDFEHHTGPQYVREIFPIPQSLYPTGKLTLAIHIQGVPVANALEQFSPVLAPWEQIQPIRSLDTLDYLRSSWIHYFAFILIGATGIVFLLLYGVNPAAREHLWLAFFLLAIVVLRAGEFATVVNLHIPSPVWETLFILINAARSILAVEFVFAFLNRRVTWPWRIVELASLVSLPQLLLLLPTSSQTYFQLVAITESIPVHHLMIAGQIASVFCFILLLPSCFRSRLTEMRWIAGANIFLIIEESNRGLSFISLPHLSQDVFYHGLDIDLRAIANLFFAVVMLIAMTFRLRRIQDRNRRVEQDIAAARNVQQILIPDHLPTVPGLTIESAYIPAQEVGGDFFQVLPLPNSDSAFVVLGDVSGKGLPAAMTVSLLVGALRTAAETCSTPAQLLAVLNRRLHGRSEGFATCLALLVTPSGHITLANAGHPSPYLNGQEIETAPNLPLGLVPEITYSETTLQVLPGQRLTLVTDGVVEATSTTHELFGFDRTQSVSIQPAASIAQAAQTFSLGAPQADDITVLTLALA